jgi:hypothetical protein
MHTMPTDNCYALDLGRDVEIVVQQSDRDLVGASGFWNQNHVDESY